MVDKHRKQQMRDRHKDLVAEKIVPDNAQTQSSAFRLAFDDPEFLCRDDLRPIRLQLEILKPENPFEIVKRHPEVQFLEFWRFPIGIENGGPSRFVHRRYPASEGAPIDNRQAGFG